MELRENVLNFHGFGKRINLHEIIVQQMKGAFPYVSHDCHVNFFINKKLCSNYAFFP